jgi:hypothetical protein
LGEGNRTLRNQGAAQAPAPHSNTPATQIRPPAGHVDVNHIVDFDDMLPDDIPSDAWKDLIDDDVEYLGADVDFAPTDTDDIIDLREPGDKDTIVKFEDLTNDTERKLVRVKVNLSYRPLIVGQIRKFEW